MNERIDELFGQTMDQAVPETWTTLTHAQLLIVKDKFAELIVRECAKSLWTEECHTSDLAVEEYNRNSKKIKQHFGVEE